MCLSEKYVVFNETFIEQLNEIFLKLEQNPEVSVIMLKGNERSFCIGADVKLNIKMNVNDSVFNDTYDKIYN